MQAKSVFAVLGGALLLGGCAGTPLGPQVAAGKRAKCEHVVGSLMCVSPDEVEQGNLNDPSVNQHQIGH